MIEAEAKISKRTKQVYEFDAKIEVPEGFGEIGAVIVELKHNSPEKFIDTVSVDNSVEFSCTSWVQPKNLIPHQRRIFFSTKVPSYHLISSYIT